MEGQRPLPAPVRIDIRQVGGGIDPDQEDNAILASPHVAYFPSVAPDTGYEYGRYGACVVDVPYTLHRDYGGELLDNQIKNLVMVHMAEGEYPVIRWAGVIPEWISLLPSSTSGVLILQWYAEDPTYTFNVYISQYVDRDFTLRTPVTDINYGDHTLSITGLTPDVVYYFYITAVSDEGLEGPPSVVRGARVL